MFWAFSSALRQIDTPAPLLIISPWAQVAPDSNIQARFSASRRASNAAHSRSQMCARSAADMRGHEPWSNAWRAAATAASASANVGSATRAMTSSVVGDTTAM